MLLLPLLILRELTKLLVLPVALVGLAWLLLSSGWALLVSLAVGAYLKWLGWAARISHGGVMRMLAARAVVLADARAVTRMHENGGER